MNKADILREHYQEIGRKGQQIKLKNAKKAGKTKKQVYQELSRAGVEARLKLSTGTKDKRKS